MLILFCWLSTFSLTIEVRLNEYPNPTLFRIDLPGCNNCMCRVWCWLCAIMFVYKITYSHFGLGPPVYLDANLYQRNKTKSYHQNINPMVYHRPVRMICSGRIRNDVLCICRFEVSLKWEKKSYVDEFINITLIWTVEAHRFILLFYCCLRFRCFHHLS